MGRQQTGGCQVLKGLLILRECGRTPVALCSSCGIRVCAEHLVHGANGQPLCPECAVQAQGEPSQASQAQWVRRRKEYYSLYRYTPYPYLFLEDDYAALDRDAESSLGPPEPLDVDDYMES